jgi:putative transposase
LAVRLQLARFVFPLRILTLQAYNRARNMPDHVFLPRRRSVRLTGFDYSKPSAYFLTICVQDQKPLFGTVIDQDVVLNALGRIVNECWLEIPIHFPNVELAAHVVMPNHDHGIVIIRDQKNRGPAKEETIESATNGQRVAKVERRARHAVPLRPKEVPRDFASPTVGSIPTIIGAFKAAVSRRLAKVSTRPQKSVWQRGYFEHVIRDQNDFRNTCEYIRTNPARHTFKRKNPYGHGMPD